MNKKITMLIMLIIISIVGSKSFAGSDGNLNLKDSKKIENEVSDCFEKLNRGIFAFNQGLDKVYLNL